jgi:hypothetical protein
LGVLGFGLGVDGVVVVVDGVLLVVVDGVLLVVVDGDVVFVVEGDDDVVFFDAFFLACFFGWALRPGTVPPTSTPATAAGAATLIVSAFVPVPAVAVLPPPPELAMPNAAAKAAITAISPKAIVRGSICWGSTFSSRAFPYVYRAFVGSGRPGGGEGAHPPAILYPAAWIVCSARAAAASEVCTLRLAFE